MTLILSDEQPSLAKAAKRYADAVDKLELANQNLAMQDERMLVANVACDLAQEEIVEAEKELARYFNPAMSIKPRVARGPK